MKQLVISNVNSHTNIYTRPSAPDNTFPCLHNHSGMAAVHEFHFIMPRHGSFLGRAAAVGKARDGSQVSIPRCDTHTHTRPHRRLRQHWSVPCLLAGGDVQSRVHRCQVCEIPAHAHTPKEEPCNPT